MTLHPIALAASLLVLPALATAQDAIDRKVNALLVPLPSFVKIVSGPGREVKETSAHAGSNGCGFNTF
jgi:hypothetical protein